MMLAAPFVTRPFCVGPSDSAAPSPTADDPTNELPVGVLQLRGRLMFSGPCFGIELTEASYPVRSEDQESATVIWWQPTAVDPGNPSACASRSGELGEVRAAVRALPDEDDPDASPIGYAIEFRVPMEIETNGNVEIAIILDRSTADHLQALVIRPTGVPGLSFDRVDAIDPPFEARPSAPPVAVLPPTGIYLLRYPLGSDGPCVVIELGPPSYPLEPSTEGSARIRSWEPWARDAEGTAQCLTRRGEIHEAEGTVVAVQDSGDVVIAYHVIFPAMLGGAVQTMEISFDLDQPRPGRLEATAIEPADVGRLDFDRVDSIDPPLGSGG